MRLDAHDVARALVEDGVPILRRYMTATSCILSTRIGLAVFEACGVEARAEPVEAIAINAAWKAMAASGADMHDQRLQPPEVWSIVLGAAREKGEPGHLVIASEDLLIDLTLDQMARPEKLIPLRPAAFYVDEEFWSERRSMSYAIGEGASLEYRAAERGERWWADSPNWGNRDAALRRRIAGEILRETGLRNAIRRG